ncbi:blue light sensor protein [Stenotrophomonas sp. SAU14A_NAIMI4_5]|uniref:BLUF domain-containing protein n=1 Tax=Stenotrophomonas sp. SAU14A_NAIMI4_5 TaxID=2072413 RepID=UPI000D53FE26|nr:BLUF domain-containing protein [Stenotrophomonas sp. SAU14A_NAIMI4_5]AWH48571.1 blue light sensor protein [Stenotrophomonas sp. SAU14A_NAIMI4_5]
MPIRAVVYVSEAVPGVANSGSGVPSQKLEELVQDAARFNRDAGVTGVLLFDGTRFLQYLEGPEDGLAVAYSRVLGSESHTGVVELQRGRVGQRRLPFWPMRWLPVERQDLASVAHADWTRFNRRGDAEAMNATAMDRLLHLVQVRAGMPVTAQDAMPLRSAP